MLVQAVRQEARRFPEGKALFFPQSRGKKLPGGPLEQRPGNLSCQAGRRRPPSVSCVKKCTFLDFSFSCLPRHGVSLKIKSMNKTELIHALAEKSSIDLELARNVVETTIALMKQQLLDGGRIEIRGFGSFAMREYKGYTGRNPKTGQSVTVRPKRQPFFKCGRELKQQVNDED